MSKQELLGLLEDPQRFDEYARAAFRAFDRRQKGHLGADEIRDFLVDAARDLGEPPPPEERVQEVTSDLSGADEFISLEKFKAFLRQVFADLAQEAN